MRRQVYHIYDTILKLIMLIYESEFLKYIGVDKKIKEILKTEIILLNGNTKILDYLCQFDDGTLGNIEFQFPVAYSEDLKRFFDYNVLSELTFESETNTIVVNFTDCNSGDKELKIGDSKDFHPKIFYLGDIDFEKELENIQIKLGLFQLERIINKDIANIQLTYEEEISLLLMSLPPKYEDKSPFLKQTVGILKNEKLIHDENINGFKSVIKLEIEKFLTLKQQEKLKGDVNVSTETEDLLRQVINDVNRKYELEAFDEGYTKGKEQGYTKGKEQGYNLGKQENNEYIALKMKGKYSPEEISNITGLNIESIEKL